uniref:RRM domain-containing protein n=1 Tax=Alexandrium catenella TaxID=2925 RepID=A0A7S1Q2X6_ALECA|mmetsp:Transcript_14284/g.39169  ORF Transcript_14284/g.39169 Transcript_14284/m.39169 type:complete len:461 (+) Transcript_14284:87-1469(+)
MARGTQAAEQQRRKGAAAGGMPKDGQARARTADSATLEDQCHPRKIFVGGLPHKTTTQQLREHFSQFGVIVDAVVLRWPDGRSRGFGYVTFTTASAAATVLAQTHRIGGRQIDTKRAVPGTNKLFVGGLPQNCAATELREHFEAFGVVSDAVVMIDPATNRSRGFGFVCFLPGQEGAASVASALEHYDHHRIRGKWIEVKSAVSPHKLATSESSPSAQSQQEKESPCTSTTASEAPSPAQQPEAPQQFTLEAMSPVAKPAVCCAPPGLVEPRKAVAAATPTPKTTAKGLGFPAPPGLVEPRKVVLPTSNSMMAAALAAVNTPEALAAARRTKYTPLATACQPAMVMSPANPSESPMPPMLPHRVQQPAPVSGLPPASWSMFQTPEAGPVQLGGLCGTEGSFPSSSLGRVSLFDDAKPGAFATSESLQRSLEELFRQQSLRLSEGDAKARVQEPASAQATN